MHCSNRKKCIRILHCPVSTGGNAAQLAKEERRLGADSLSLALNQTKYDKTSDIVVNAKSPFAAYLKGLYYFFKSLFCYDVIHYYSGQTLVPGRIVYNPRRHKGSKGLYIIYNFFFYYLEMIDVRILKLTGKKIIATFTGREARLYENATANTGNFLTPNLLARNNYDPASDIIKKRRIGLFAKYADVLLAVNPDLMRSLPPSAKFMPYPIAGDPSSRTPTNNTDMVRFLHAPTNRDIKGTAFILDASRQLLIEGFPHELVILEGKTHAEVETIIQSVDIIIDQLLIGWYGGLAVEAMCCRKAVIAHLNGDDLACIPRQMVRDLPIIAANPNTIKEVMQNVIAGGKRHCEKAGLKSYHFAMKWHRPSRIARSIAHDAGYADRLLVSQP